MAKAQRSQTTPRPAQIVQLRRAITMEMVRLTTPDSVTIEKISQAFGLATLDGDDIRTTHRDLIVNSAGSLADGLNERAMEIHLQRLVGSLVNSAHAAGQLYSKAVTEARDATSKLANDDRDEDRSGPVGFESQAQRKREFAADMALQSFALRLAAEGAAQGYKQILGDDWKPYERHETRPSLDRQAATTQMAAFG